MAEQSPLGFQVHWSGAYRGGTDVQAMSSALRQVFKINPAGGYTVIANGLERDTAERLLAAFDATGAVGGIQPTPNGSLRTCPSCRREQPWAETCAACGVVISRCVDAMIRRATAPGPRTPEVAVGSYIGAMLERSRAYQLRTGAIHALVTFLPGAWALAHHVGWLAWLLFGAGILGALATLRRIHDPSVCPVRSQLARWGSWEDVAAEVDGAFGGPRLVLSGAKSTLSMAGRWLVYDSRAETHIIPAEEIPVYLRVGRVDVGVRETKRSRTVVSRVYEGQFQAIWLGLADGTLLDLPIAAFSKAQVEAFGCITDQLERYGAGQMLGTTELKKNWQDPSYRAFRVEASARERARIAASAPS